MSILITVGIQNGHGWFNELDLLLLDSPSISILTLTPNPTALTTENLVCSYDLQEQPRQVQQHGIRTDRQQ